MDVSTYSVLESCPDDVWRLLASLLRPEDLISLWRACNKRLLPRLCPAVLEFRQEDYFEIPFVALNMFKLRTLVISASIVSLPPFSLLALPSTLQELSFNFSVAQSCWIYPVGRQPYPTGDGEPSIKVISLGRLFPQLHTCILLGQDAWTNFQLGGWQDSTATKRVTWTTAWKEEWVASLPTGLVHLSVPNLHISAPESLQHLSVLRRLEVNELTKSCTTWQLPQMIEKVKLPFHTELTTLLPTPPSLTDLNLHTSQNLGSFVRLLPATLHTLRLACKITDPTDFTNFPPNLQRLSLFGETWHDHMAPCLPRSLTELAVESKKFATWDGLPENLLHFFCGPMTPPSVRSRVSYTETQMRSLPRGLLTLWLNTSTGIPTTTECLPPRLEELTIASKTELSDAWMMQLPSSVKFLRVDTIICNFRRLLDQYCQNQQTIHIPGSFRSILKSHMAPGLELIVNDWKVEMADSDSVALPSNLTSLTISHGVSQLSLNFFKSLPTTLTTLEYMNDLRGCTIDMTDLASLPRGLTSLRIDRIELPPLKESRSPCPNPSTGSVSQEIDPTTPPQIRSTIKGWINTLPPNLHHLTLGVDMPIHYKALMLLPPTLLTLHLPKAYGGRSKDFAALPPSLTSLSVRYAGARLPNDSVVVFPPHLTLLDIGAEHWSELALSRLPRSLTRLTLGSSIIPAITALALARGELQPSIPKISKASPEPGPRTQTKTVRCRVRASDATGI